VIPAIGVMVGAYIIVRMISLATRRGERKEALLVRVFSILTMVLAMICTADLFLSGSLLHRTLGFLDTSLVSPSSVQPQEVAPRATLPTASPEGSGFDADKAGAAYRAQAAVISNVRVLKEDIGREQYGGTTARFVIQNDNDVAVADLTIECTFVGPSGTATDRKTHTIYDTVPAKSKRTFGKINLGYLNGQANKFGCHVTAAQARP
jgi:hypothetical protein